jgi:hypothetical protein
LARGAFSAGGRICDTACQLEGLLEALRFLPEADRRRRARIRDAVNEGLAFLLRAQLRAGRHAGAVPRAIARLPETHPSNRGDFNIRATEVRIDYVQHALSAFLRARAYYELLLPRR